MSGASVSNSFQVAMGFVLLEENYLRYFFAYVKCELWRAIHPSALNVRRDGCGSDTLKTREKTNSYHLLWFWVRVTTEGSFVPSKKCFSGRSGRRLISLRTVMR